MRKFGLFSRTRYTEGMVNYLLKTKICDGKEKLPLARYIFIRLLRNLRWGLDVQPSSLGEGPPKAFPVGGVVWDLLFSSPLYGRCLGGG